ncbi:hypothetical protein PAGU2196_43100 [Pseudomonas sp. PAGU 2196]|nr:hypothetical protein PAGU2196_43100 [Pseudomonas sp. PAGU 2196]
MLAGEQHLTGAEHVRECRITGITGRLFETGAGGDLDVDHTKFDAEVGADVLAMGWPRVSGGLQAVMDMDGAQRGRGVGAGVIGQQVQQDGGVQAAREGDVPGGGLEPGGEVDQGRLT